MSTHAYTPRHSITIRPIGGIQSEEIQYCLNLLKSLNRNDCPPRRCLNKESVDIDCISNTCQIVPKN